MATNVTDLLLTAEEAAARLKCSRTTLIRREQLGLIQAVRSGQRRLYWQGDVERLLTPIVHAMPTTAARARLKRASR